MSNARQIVLWLVVSLVLFVVIVGVVVSLGVVVSRFLARNDPMDEHQARVFGAFRPSIWQRVVGHSIEIFAATFDLGLRGLWQLRILRPPRDPGSGTPIVLLPGYTENAGALWWFARKLRRRGFRPFLVDFPSTFAAIDRNVEFLRQKLNAVCEATGSQRVAVVAHSMGGVVTRALLLSDPNHRVLTLVALSSPFRGTHVARLGALFRLGESVIDMSPNSPFAHRFLPSAAASVPIRSIVGEQENIVAPPWSCVLPACEVHLLSMPVGHDAPLYLEESYACLERWLLQDGVLRAERAAG
jgi:pimeloyl-ACP methyl ester carboxylesterase